MPEPIKVGDLVQVIRSAPCGCAQSVGFVFTVSVIRMSRNSFSCAYCRGPRAVVLVAEGHPRGGIVEMNRLKRIPPLEELESTKHTEELTA